MRKRSVVVEGKKYGSGGQFEGSGCCFFIRQAFHSSANLRKTAFLALVENSASVNFLHGRIPENPQSHPIELPSLVQDSPVAIYKGCQNFRDSALGPN